MSEVMEEFDVMETDWAKALTKTQQELLNELDIQDGHYVAKRLRFRTGFSCQLATSRPLVAMGLAVIKRRENGPAAYCITDLGKRVAARLNGILPAMVPPQMLLDDPLDAMRQLVKPYKKNSAMRELVELMCDEFEHMRDQINELKQERGDR